MTILGAQYGVLDGTAEPPDGAPEGAGPMPIRVVVFQDGNEQYHFPLSEKKARDLGEQLINGPKQEEPPTAQEAADILVPEREPTKDELERMARLAKGLDNPVVGSGR